MRHPIRAGFVGLGDMGGAMAGRIIDAGFPTTLWARRPESFIQFERKSYERATDLAHLGRSSDVVGVCVFSDDDVYEVVLGKAGIMSGMAPGGIIVVHSTVGENTMGALAEAASDRGVLILDAPVSGGRAGALEGKLAVMVGGDSGAYERAKRLMHSYGETVLRVGELGAGQRAKVLNNVLTFCNIQTAYLALQMAGRLGLEGDAIAELLQVGGAKSRALDELVNRLMPDPVRAQHSLTMVEKDTRIFQEICAAIGVERTILDELAEQAIVSVKELGER